MGFAPAGRGPGGVPGAQADDRDIERSRVNESVSPSGRAASVAAIRSRAGAWITGSSGSALIPAPSRVALPRERHGATDDQDEQAGAGDRPRTDGARE